MDEQKDETNRNSTMTNINVMIIFLITIILNRLNASLKCERGSND